MPRILKLKQIAIIVKECILEESDEIVDQLLDVFDDRVIPYEDAEDPARPSLCRDELKLFLKESILDNIEISDSGKKITVGIGDDEKLGFGEELNTDTTDCIKIIGTILQGIIGEYVLVTRGMTGGPEGRFGGAFILPNEEYRYEAAKRGWDVNRPMWKFSNFPGVPDFFKNVDLSPVLAKCTKKLAEALKKI